MAAGTDLDLHIRSTCIMNKRPRLLKLPFPTIAELKDLRGDSLRRDLERIALVRKTDLFVGLCADLQTHGLELEIRVETGALRPLAEGLIPALEIAALLFASLAGRPAFLTDTGPINRLGSRRSSQNLGFLADAPLFPVTPVARGIATGADGSPVFVLRYFMPWCFALAKVRGGAAARAGLVAARSCFEAEAVWGC
jgi:hypothetical protein